MSVLLENKETAQLNSVIRIGEKIAVQMNAIVSSETGTATSYSESITDYGLYIANKELCREKLDEFQTRVRIKEDEILAAYHKKVEIPSENPIEEPIEEDPSEEVI